MTDLRAGRFANGLEFLAAGDGPPAVLLPGLGASNRLPTGVARRAVAASVAPFVAAGFTAHWVPRRVGLAPGASLADLAADCAEALAGLGPVVLHGTSTGGSLALQVALDHPAAVRRLALAASAHTLGQRGRRIQREMIEALQAGRTADVWTPIVEASVPPWSAAAAVRVARLLGARVTASDAADMLITLLAEDAFDAGPRLASLAAPLLVLGGEADPFYSPDLFRATADAAPDGRCVLFPGKGHGYAAGSSASRLAAGFLLG